MESGIDMTIECKEDGVFGILSIILTCSLIMYVVY